MNAILRKSRFSFAVATLATGVFAVGTGTSLAAETNLTLSGAKEVPPVNTSASGKGTITVGTDRSVSGSVTTSGISGTAAHIHEAAAGKNGPVIIPLSKTSANMWSVPAGAKLTDAQYQSYKADDLYVNVHSEAHKDGEIRAQLKP
jgi:hypothetical protein